MPDRLETVATPGVTRVRRPRYLFAIIEDEELIDLGAFFAGSLETSSHARLKVISPLSGEPLDVQPDTLGLIAGIANDEWTDVRNLTAEDRLAPATLEALLQNGILIGDDERHGSTGERDRLLTRTQWEPHAALFHVMSRWVEGDMTEIRMPESDDDLARGSERLARTADEFGPPAGHFHSVETADGEVELPMAQADTPLRKLLTARKTVRYFDTERCITSDQVASLLYFTFGCQGYTRVSPDVVLLKKTSPSGGAMHAVEAYPLILNVEGIATGLYHYNVERHALYRLKTLDPDAATELADAATSGQSFFKTANMLVFLTARFYRHNWKYRKHKKSYRSVLMGAAHMSQTFYLLCTEMKLGNVFSAALNDELVEKTLGLDFIEEGVVGALGCGVLKSSGFDFSFEPEPYQPRKTII